MDGNAIEMLEVYAFDEKDALDQIYLRVEKLIKSGATEHRS